jgi:hypothetical protein
MALGLLSPAHTSNHKGSLIQWRSQVSILAKLTGGGERSFGEEGRPGSCGISSGKTGLFAFLSEVVAFSSMKRPYSVLPLE